MLLTSDDLYQVAITNVKRPPLVADFDMRKTRMKSKMRMKSKKCTPQRPQAPRRKAACKQLKSWSFTIHSSGKFVGQFPMKELQSWLGKYEKHMIRVVFGILVTATMHFVGSVLQALHHLSGQ